jgi:hypothetical protein
MENMIRGLFERDFSAQLFLYLAENFSLKRGISTPELRIFSILQLSD